MIFQGKFDKALEQLKARRGQARDAEPDIELADKLEKGDKKALLLSALLVFLPAALLFLGLVLGLAYWFFIR